MVGSNGQNHRTKKTTYQESTREREILMRELFGDTESSLPLVHQLARTVWSFRLAYEKALGDLSGPQVWILLVLSKRDLAVGMTQSELTCLMQVDASAITRLVKTMDAKGWIRREPDPSDNRLTRVFLTDAGRSIVQGLPERAHAIEERMTRNLTPQQLEELRHILTILETTAREEYDELQLTPFS